MSFRSRSAIIQASVCAFALLRLAHAEPVLVEPGWTLVQTVQLSGPMAAHYNPVDDLVYVGRRGSGADGLYRIDATGIATRRASGSNVAGVVIDPNTGNTFFSEDYGGVIYRVELDSTGRTTWVSGFHSGDDDPVGMAFAPSGYAGDVLLPGEAVVVDRGNSGPDEIWRWSLETAENEVLLHADDGTLVDATDVAVGLTDVYVVDVAGANPGIIYQLNSDGSLTVLPLSEPIADPAGIAMDPATGELLVLDSGGERIVRVVPASGVVTDVFTGFSFSGDNWAGVDVSPDGRRIIVTDHGADSIYTFALCEADSAEDDCNGNGVWDFCDTRLGTSDDCNRNGVPDTCDVLSGTSGDCEPNGIPDECPICPTLEAVFVMDTSTSMNDEASALCSNITNVVAQLLARGIDVAPALLGINNNPTGAYGCLTDNVINLLGTSVPGSPPPGVEILGDCPGGNEVAQEDWGRATAVVAGRYEWLSNSVRVIIPLSDEGPWCGDPVTTVDQDSIDHAINVSLANGVIVSPITGTGSSASVVSLAQRIATATGGTHFSSSVPAEDVASGIEQLLLEACLTAADCNDNDVPDLCDIQDATSLDCNGNDVPVECEMGSGDSNGDGLVGPTDHARFVDCMTGPCAFPACDPPLYEDPCCVLFDASAEGDVDLADAAVFQRRFTGQ